MLSAALATGVTPFLDLILSSPRAALEDVAETLREAYRWLRQGCEIGMYPYVIPFSGAAFARDPSLLPRTRTTPISVSRERTSRGNSRRRFCRSIPSSRTRYCASKAASKRCSATLEEHVAHLPSRVRSLLWILSALPIMAEHGQSIADESEVRAELYARLPAVRPEAAATRRRDGMKPSRAWSLLAPLAVCALLAGWIVLVGGQRSRRRLLDLRARGRQSHRVHRCDRFRFAPVHAAPSHGSPPAASLIAARPADISINLAAILPPDARRVVPASPFAIIASVFNLEDHLEEFMEAFGPYRDRVWLISDGSTDNTVLRLRQAGWRCFDDGVNRRKPGALRRLLERSAGAHRDRHGDRSGHPHPRT